MLFFLCAYEEGSVMKNCDLDGVSSSCNNEREVDLRRLQLISLIKEIEKETRIKLKGERNNG